MQAKHSILFKILVNRYHPGMGEGFLKNMPKEESQEILGQTISSSDPLPLLTMAYEQIKNTHYSWLSPSVQQLPKILQPLIIASFPSPQSLRLSKALNIPINNVHLSEKEKEFFLTVLLKQWKPDPIIPFQYLPPHPLLALGELNKNELVEFIDFLALYDLIETIRHVVNKKLLKTIYQALTPKKQQFLRLYLHQKEKIASPKLELERWNGDPHKLEVILHRRGLFRLGKALSGQHPDFLWQITHKLDVGRGTILARHYGPKEIPGISPALVQQVVVLLNFLKKKSEM